MPAGKIVLIGKCKNGGKNAHLKIFTSPANEILLHKCKNNKKIRECKKK